MAKKNITQPTAASHDPFDVAAELGFIMRRSGELTQDYLYVPDDDSEGIFVIRDDGDEDATIDRACMALFAFWHAADELCGNEGANAQ